jgi:hypothetical protein
MRGPRVPIAGSCGAAVGKNSACSAWVAAPIMRDRSAGCTRRVRTVGCQARGRAYRYSHFRSKFMFSRRVLLATLILSAASVAARAEDCHQYPKGRFRLACIVRNHPELEEKCMQAGMKMGLSAGAGGGVGGPGAYSSRRATGLHDYVRACEKRHLKARAS